MERFRVRSGVCQSSIRRKDGLQVGSQRSSSDFDLAKRLASARASGSTRHAPACSDSEPGSAAVLPGPTSPGCSSATETPCGGCQFLAQVAALAPRLTAAGCGSSCGRSAGSRSEKQLLDSSMGLDLPLALVSLHYACLANSNLVRHICFQSSCTHSGHLGRMAE